MKRSTDLFLVAVAILSIYAMTACTIGISSGSENVSASYNGAYGNGSQFLKSDTTLSGKLTAAEWNDLDNWSFWMHLLRSQDSVSYYEYPQYWGYSTIGRIPVQVVYEGNPAVDVQVVLKNGDETVWSARTDVFGKAEMWAGMTSLQSEIDSISHYAVEVDGIKQPFSLGLDSRNVFELADSAQGVEDVEIAFIVDATGSMSDEIDFLKADLQSIIERVEQNISSDMRIGAVFYRDEEDDYVVRYKVLTEDAAEVVSFIADQSADGGGDYPEAVHTALESALSDLQWSAHAKTRIAFLVADAPAHHDKTIVNRIHEQVMRFAAKGIKIIPVASSGVDRNCEFLFRYFAMATNGTYVFLTDDSGIGNSHIEASVGQYKVESLDDLLVRLITKYATGQ